MQKCKHCQQDYEPKQQYCSTKCRVYSKRGNDNVIKPVTEAVQSVTKPLQSVTQVIQKEHESNAIVTDNTPRKIVENVKSITPAPFDGTMCDKHGVFRGSCLKLHG